MEQGLERLFRAVGLALVTPFIVQQGILLGDHAPPSVPPLHSISITTPAITDVVAPGNVGTQPEPIALGNRPGSL
jgi:hypothetical protein